MNIRFAITSLGCAAFLAAMAPYLQAQTTSSTTWTSRDQNRDWQAIASSKDGWRLTAAVGKNSVIMKSRNGGATWEPSNSGTGPWYAIACNGDGMRLIAAQSPGVVKLSTDFGVTWIEQTGLSSVGSYSSVASNKDGTVLAAAYSGYYLSISTDSGASWTNRCDSGYWTCVDMSDDGKTIVASGALMSLEAVLKISTDSGVTWTDLHTSIDQTFGANQRFWKAIAISGDGTRIIAGSHRANGEIGGKVYIGKKSGTTGTWTWTEHLERGQWTSVAISDDGQKLTALDMAAQIHVSTNGGTTWTAQGKNDAWSSVATNQTGSLTVAGLSGGKVSTAGAPTGTGPVTYPPLPVPTPSVVWKTGASSAVWESVASSENGSVLIAAGREKNTTSYLFTSTDSGVTWLQHQGVSASNNRWVGVALNKDGSKAYACQSLGIITVGTRTGSTWTWQTVPAGKIDNINQGQWISIASDKEGKNIAATYTNGKIYVSTDSGANWTRRGLDLNTALVSVDCSADGSTFVAATSDGAGSLYLSTDYGVTWKYEPLVGAGQRSWKSVAMSSDGKLIIAGTYSGKVYLGKRAGDIWNWTTQFSDGIWAVACSDDGIKLFAVDAKMISNSKGGKIQVSTDGGATWTAQESEREWNCIATSKDGTRSIAGATETTLFITP